MQIVDRVFKFNTVYAAAIAYVLHRLLGGIESAHLGVNWTVLQGVAKFKISWQVP